MRSPSKNKIEKASADLAYQCAMSAMSTAQAYGAMFGSLLGTLRDNNILPVSKIRIVFLGAAAMIDAMEPADNVEQMAQQHMRQIIENAAKGFDIEIPPPGQTGIQRRQ